MASAAASTSNTGSPKTSAERRNQVMLGSLPNDFLCIFPPGTDASVSTSTNAAQLEADKAAAIALQQSLNGPVGGIPAAYVPTAFVPTNTRGRLSITVVEARLTKNYGLVRMDPYCRMRVGTTLFETPTDPNGSKTPKWNRTVHCYLPEGIDNVYVEIFDERAFSMDERIAWAHVTLPPAVFNNETIDDWYPMSGQQGEGKEGMLNLIIAFSPVNTAPQMRYVPVTGGVQGQPQQVGGAAGGAQAQQQAQQQQQLQQQQQQLQQQQQQQLPPDGPPEPIYTDEDIKELCEIFPTLTDDVIKSVMDEKSGNKDAAVNALLQISAE